MKVIFIILGSLFLSLGIIGIFIPGLPTTPFLLLASGCYIKSSKRLYEWLIHHKIFGKFITDYQQKKGIPLRTKIYIFVLIWLMIPTSVIFFIPILPIKIIVIIAGVIGTIVVASIKTVI